MTRRSGARAADRTASLCPRTGGVILAEDGEGIQHLVGVTDERKSYALTRNEFNDSEFTGPNFSADGQILFANIQSPGYVFAITGPWGRRPSDARH